MKKKDEFSDIIKNGNFVKDINYVIYYKNKIPSHKYSHFGIAIKNSIGHANVRNNLKRKTREIIEKNKKTFKKEYDYIIMIRGNCLKSKFIEQDKSIANLLKGIK